MESGAAVRGWKGLRCGERRARPSSHELSPPDELEVYWVAQDSA